VITNMLTGSETIQKSFFVAGGLLCGHTECELHIAGFVMARGCATTFSGMILHTRMHIAVVSFPRSCFFTMQRLFHA
jgi:hypothetical protein